MPITDIQVEAIIANQPKWRESWLTKRPKEMIHYYLAPQALRIDPTFCPIKRRRISDTFERVLKIHSTWLNYPELPPPTTGEVPTERYKATLNGVITAFKGIPDFSCIMIVKIAKMIITPIEVFNDMEHTGMRFFEGINGLCWNMQIALPQQGYMQGSSFCHRTSC